MSAVDGYAPEMLSPAVDNLVAQLTRLPGIGSRTAQRLAFHLLSGPKQEALADLVLARVNEALRSAAAAIEAKAQQMQSELLGGLGLPGMEP